MKTIGLIGGTSWVSTIDYYRYFNEGVNKQLGGMEFAKCIIYSVNYGDIQRYHARNDREATKNTMVDAARTLEQSGADVILLGANTMHMVADAVQESINIPLIHIATATAQRIVEKQLTKIALLGTKFTMEEDFFKSKLRAAGIEYIIPEEEDRNYIHTTIHGELAKGIIKEATRQGYVNIINKLVAQGAQGAILGCTEIPLLVRPEDVAVPVFDTTYIHATEAVKFALG